MSYAKASDPVRHRVTKVVGTMVAAGAVAGLLLATTPVAGQTPDIPRLVNGRPDLNGIWQAVNTANYDLEPHVARSALALRPGPFGPVPAADVLALGAVGSVPGGNGVVDGGAIPYQPWALEKKRANAAAWLTSDPEIKCYMPGVPRATYMPFPFQIFQSADYVFFAYEYAGAVRNIFLEHPGPPPADSWMGQSVGSWDGDTFVVEVTDQSDRTWFDRAGNFHGFGLRVVERYTLRGPNHIHYEATIEDDEVFTRPWTISMPLYRRMEPNAALNQFKCVEFVEELMLGHLRREPVQ